MSNNPAQELDDTADSPGTTEVADPTAESPVAGDDTQETEQVEAVVYDIDGEDVSKEDILSWREGHMRQEDHTRKSQALAEDRTRLGTLMSTVENHLDTFNAIQAEIEKLAVGDPVDIDQFEDQTEYLRAESARNKRVEQYKGLSQRVVDVQNAYFEEGHRVISETLGWSDPVKREGDKQLILGYVKSKGVTDQEFSRVTNPKIMMALLDAAKYQELQNKSPETVKRVKQAPKAVKPGAPDKAELKPLANRMYPNMK